MTERNVSALLRVAIAVIDDGGGSLTLDHSCRCVLSPYEGFPSDVDLVAYGPIRAWTVWYVHTRNHQVGLCYVTDPVGSPCTLPFAQVWPAVSLPPFVLLWEEARRAIYAD